jgi:hypothetical protein
MITMTHELLLVRDSHPFHQLLTIAEAREPLATVASRDSKLRNAAQKLAQMRTFAHGFQAFKTTHIRTDTRRYFDIVESCLRLVENIDEPILL